MATQDTMLLGTANSDGTFTGVTASGTTSQTIPPGANDAAVLAIIGNGTITSGVITIEEAYAPRFPYSGTWSTVTTVNASDVTGNAQKAVHISPNALLSMRARISTAIGGGGGISVALRYTDA